MKGKKTTIIEPARKIVSVLEKNGLEIGAGIIVSIKSKSDGRVRIKIIEQSGCKLLTVVSKMYKQEIRIYTTESTEEILKILRRDLDDNKFLIQGL